MVVGGMPPLDSQQVYGLLQTQPGATVFLVGAGGCGMSGLGHLLLDQGFRVAGSDLVPNEETRQLMARGARIFAGHDADHIRSTHPVLVVHTSAVGTDNPELQASVALGIPVVRRAVLLAAVVNAQRGICVAGMHGKTTTSSWLAHALDCLGACPGYAVGSLVPQLRPHARSVAGLNPGASPHWFVAETDESDGTFTLFHPENAIVLNVDEEHLDHFANLEAICAAFDQFARQARGSVVWCADDANLARMFAGRSGMISYGYSAGADYHIQSVTTPTQGTATGGRTFFELAYKGQGLGRFGIRLCGAQNVSNATAVVAMLHHMGYEPQKIAQAIEGFTGAARRQQCLFEDESYRIIDDYGHHPAEIRAVLRGVKLLGDSRLLVAFQPHRYTRTQHLMEQFATSFGEADLLWLAEIYAASESPIPGVSSARLAEVIRAKGQAVHYVPEVNQVGDAVRQAMQPGDVVLFLGAGDITKAGRALARELQREKVVKTQQAFAQFARQLGAETVIRYDEPMAGYTTWRIGGPADIHVKPASEEDLKAILQFCADCRVPWFIMGRGSNLLVRDGGIRGVVILLAQSKFSEIRVEGQRVVCGAGARLKEIVRDARRNGLGGLEFLEGIPGSLGGALRMNAGAMGLSLFQVIESMRVMDKAGQISEVSAGSVAVEYRHCPLLEDHIALSAVLRAVPAERAEIDARLSEYSQRRWTTQPAAPSAGCVFKNPSQTSAGRLIDECGLKGLRVGGAVVSDKHANFIVNDGQASAQDVLDLVAIVRNRVKVARGIELKTEIKIVGEPVLA